MPTLGVCDSKSCRARGTYQLLEAQLDRFMLMIQVGYPSLEEELEVVKNELLAQSVEIKPALSQEDSNCISSIGKRVTSRK